LGVASGGGGGSTNVNIHNYTDVQPTVQTSPNGDINVTFRRAMDAAAADAVAQFGLEPFTGQ
jgi:hypothetical protein